MGGKPAARLGDATTSGGPIIQGSIGVLIGAPSGVACSACPGGMAVGNPVNPALGAKVLSNEIDIKLPGSLSFILSRSYSSYKTDSPAPVGIFGPGWQTTNEISLLIKKNELIVNDTSGRSIYFFPLVIGESTFSKSEKLWLVRGGVNELKEDNVLTMIWQSLPEKLRCNPHYYFITNSPLGPWRVLGYSETLNVNNDNDILPPELPERRVLQCIADRFGYTLQYIREISGPFTGEITKIIDGSGRAYRIELQRLAKETRKLSIKSGWGDDNGVRISAVYLTDDPLYDDLSEKLLVRYEYSENGELKVVYDRSEHWNHKFNYNLENTGQMVSHQYVGRPITSYTYDIHGRVISQINPEGLDYQFSYTKSTVTVIDSLKRRQTYHFKGERGLRRLVKHDLSDS